MSDAYDLRLIYSVRDFQLSLSAVDFFLEVDEAATYTKIELRRFRCYLDAAVIAYWRPFSRSRGLPALTFEGIGLTPTPVQIDLHERLKAYRNKVVAHSDPDRMRILVTSFNLKGPHQSIVVPIWKYAEGLEFLSDRTLLIEWLHLLIHVLIEKIVGQAQTGPHPYRFQKDHLFPDD